MKKKLNIIILLISIGVFIGFNKQSINADNAVLWDYHETFDNSTAKDSYTDGSFTGEGGITWSFGDSRNQGDYQIDGNGIILRKASTSYLEATFDNGIGILYFEYRKAFTGASPRQLEVIIDGEVVLTTEVFGNASGLDETVYSKQLEINKEGQVTIKIKNVGTTSTDRYTTFDNFKWTNYETVSETLITTNITQLFDSNNSITTEIEAEYGEDIIIPVETEGFQFAVVNGFLRDDFINNSTIPITNDLNIQLVYAKENNAVLFLDSNGKLLSYTWVLAGASVVAPDISQVSKPGYKISETPWLSNEGDSSLDNITSSRVYTLQYQLETTNPIVVNVNGVEEEYQFNEVVTLKASSGFVAWVDEDKNVISTNETYKFSALYNRTINQSSSADLPTNPIITMSNDLKIRSDYQSFLGQLELRDGDTLVEYGLVVSDDGLLRDVELTLDNGIKATSNVLAPDTNEFLLTIDKDYLIVRAFLTVRNALGVIETFYSNNQYNDVVIVTFDTDGGEAIEPVAIKGGSIITKPSKPIKYLSEFLGWFVDEEVFDFDMVITNDLTITAKWKQLFEQEVYKFDFGNSSKTGYDTTSFTFTNTNGDTHTLNKQRAQINNTNDSPHDNQGQMLVLAPVGDKNAGISFVEFDFRGIENLSKIEFQFTAWNQAALDRISGFNDAVFYLQVEDEESWKTLSDTNGNENLLDILNKEDFSYKWVTFNNLSTGKYRLYYYAPSANNNNTDQAIVIDDLNVFGLTDILDGNIVTFDYNYVGSPSNLLNSVSNGGLAIEPSLPNRLGYEFLGWFIEEEEFDFNTPITSNITLTAKWQQSEIVITYDFGYADIAPHLEFVEVGENVLEIDQPERDGYTFLGWYQTAIGSTFNNQFDFNTNLTENIRLLAKWEINTPDALKRNDELLKDYYKDIKGKNDEELVLVLRSILKSTHINPTSYDEARYILDKADQTLYDENLMVGIYYRHSITAIWDGGSTWAREHVWPNSKLGMERVGGSDRNQGSDLHNLRAINPSINSTRSNRYFSNTTLNIPIGHTIGTNGYYPGDEDLGDVARILMYMAIRYDYLMLTNNKTLLTIGTYTMESAYMGLLDLLYNWHLNDPVDEFEIRRNEVIYNNQGNRNPFIDHPELFEEVFKYYVEIDLMRNDLTNEFIITNINVFKVELNYNEFFNRKEYYNF